MTPTIYIAGASIELPRVKAAMAAALDLGYEITHDWTRQFDGGKVDADRSVEELFRASHTDIDAIERATTFLFLSPSVPVCTGALFELGVAAKLKRDCIGLWPEIIWSGRRHSCFWSICDHVVETDADALDVLEVSIRGSR